MFSFTYKKSGGFLREQFVLNTKGSCLFCLEVILEYANGTDKYTSITSLLRYLGIPVRDICGGDGTVGLSSIDEAAPHLQKSLDLDEMMIQLCRECQKSVSTATRHIEMMDLPQTELDFCLDSIRKIILESNGSSEKMEEFQRRNGRIYPILFQHIVDHIRDRLVAECTKVVAISLEVSSKPLQSSVVIVNEVTSDNSGPKNEEDQHQRHTTSATSNHVMTTANEASPAKISYLSPKPPVFKSPKNIPSNKLNFLKITKDSRISPKTKPEPLVKNHSPKLNVPKSNSDSSKNRSPEKVDTVNFTASKGEGNKYDHQSVALKNNSTRASKRHQSLVHNEAERRQCNFPGCLQSFGTEDQLKAHQNLYHSQRAQVDVAKNVENLSEKKSESIIKPPAYSNTNNGSGTGCGENSKSIENVTEKKKRGRPRNERKEILEKIVISAEAEAKNAGERKIQLRQRQHFSGQQNLKCSNCHQTFSGKLAALYKAHVRKCCKSSMGAFPPTNLSSSPLPPKISLSSSPLPPKISLEVFVETDNLENRPGPPKITGSRRQCKCDICGKICHNTSHLSVHQKIMHFEIASKNTQSSARSSESQSSLKTPPLIIIDD